MFGVGLVELLLFFSRERAPDRKRSAFVLPSPDTLYRTIIFGKEFFGKCRIYCLLIVLLLLMASFSLIEFSGLGSAEGAAPGN